MFVENGKKEKKHYSLIFSAIIITIWTASCVKSYKEVINYISNEPLVMLCKSYKAHTPVRSYTCFNFYLVELVSFTYPG